MSEATVADRRLHPAALAIALARGAPQFVLAVPALAYFAADFPLGVAIALAGAGLLISMAIAWLVWSRFRYGAGEAEFVIESGVLARNRRAIPYDRVQDVSISRPLLARLFGVAVVTIETGGGGKDEAELNCVDIAEAERLRDVIRHRVRGAQSAEASAEIDAEPDLFAMGVSRLALSGLFSFSLAFAAIFGAIFQNFMDFIPDWPLDLLDYVDERDFAVVRAFEPIWGAAALIGIVLLGLLSGLATSFIRDWGFRLTRTANGFRRRRGLFTWTDVVIPLRRVQAAVFATGPARRAFGWRALALRSLGGDGKQGEDHLVIPLGKPSECAPVLDALTLPLPPDLESFARSSARFAARRALLYSLGVVAVFAGLIPTVGAIWPVLLAIAPACALAWLQWRHHGHVFAGDLLFVRRGVWRQRTVAFAGPKIQSLTIARGPIQRPLGLATLIVATAGASALATDRIVDLPLSDARALREDLADRARGPWL